MMYKELEQINTRPRPFEFYTAEDLWTSEHTSGQMLAYHLKEDVDLSSRNTAFIDLSVDWITARFGVGEGTRIIDFGCGPGLYTSRLARTGAAVTGIDFSERSIRHARSAAKSEGMEIDYLHRNYLEYESGDRFDLVMMIMCDFCALSPEQRQKLLTTFHTLLAPGGSILLDVYSLIAYDRIKESASYEANLLDGFWSAQPYYGFLNTFKYEEEKLVLDKYTIVEADRTRTVYNWLQYFSPEVLEKEFTRCGLTVDEICGDVAGAPFEPSRSEFAVVATK